MPDSLKFIRQSQFLVAATLFASLFLLLSSRVPAQTAGTPDSRGDASYSYAVFVGTGLYRFDDRQIFVLRIPVSWQLRELEPDQMGVKLLLPVAIGIQNFDNLDDLLGFQLDDVQTISRMRPVRGRRRGSGPGCHDDHEFPR